MLIGDKNEGRDTVSDAVSLPFLMGGERKNNMNSGKNYVISGETKKRLEKFLYRELEVDSTSVEINELLDLLEGAKEQ